MTIQSLTKKIITWYGFRCLYNSDSKIILLEEDGTENYCEFYCVEDLLKSFYEVMLITNHNLQSCNYKIWSDEELSFIAAL